MTLSRCVGGALLALAVSPMVFAGKARPCVTPDEAAAMPKRDICLAAHVYDVVQLQDGTRFLDVCSPETPDEGCRFTILSKRDDRAEVGDLGQYRDRDVQIRGTVEAMQGRSGILLSHARQFSGGPPKFRPNPRLLRGFTGDEGRPPVDDPNLKPQGGGRPFMNSKDRVTILRK